MWLWRILWWLLKAPFSLVWQRPYRVQIGRPFAVQVIRVQDGDSLIVRPSQGRRNEEYRVRLYGIDAPERGQRYGREARDCLQRLVHNRTDLMLEAVDTDRYGRLVGVLYYRATHRRSINLLMVEQGLAYWYRRYGGHGLGLEQAEQEAQRERRGVWSARRRVAPWNHRRARRPAAARGGYLKWLLLAAVVGVAVCVALLWLRFA